MASIQSNTNNTYYAILIVNETNYSVEDNYSDVYYELNLYSGSKNFSGYTIGYKVNIDNSQVAYHDNTGNQTSMNDNSSKLIVSGTKRIYHDPDGTKRSMPISFEIFTNNYSYLPVSLSASGSMDLTDLPRDTSFETARINTANDFNLGDNETVYFSNPSGSKIKLSIQDSIGSKFYCNDRIVSGSNYTFEFTDSELDTLYKAMGNSNSLPARVYLKTFYDEISYYMDYKNITISLTGNQKTGHINLNESWKRTKRFVNVNGKWKRSVRWVNVNGIWRRCI